MVLCTALTSFAQIFYKKASSSLSSNIISWITNYDLIIGLSLYAVGAVMMIYAFKDGEVTVLYPIIALSYIWVSLLAVYFFHETVTVFEMIGIGLVVAGVIFIGFGGKNSKTIKYAEVIE